MLKRIFQFVMIYITLFLASKSHAGDFQWSGLYRIEGYSIKNSSLDSAGKEKAFGLQHLILRPRIEAADGITIRSRFDIFNGFNSFPSNQLGAIWGSGVGTSPTSPEGSNVMSQAQKPDTLQVTELYLTLHQEFGALVAGRVPLQFGLGMVHNSGQGAFDHWLDNRDLVGYKIVMGNLSVLPMYGKVSEGAAGNVDLEKNDDVTDIMVQFQYENVDTGVEMGLFYQGRTATSGNDIPEKGSEFIVGGPGARKSRMSTRNFSLYGLKDSKQWRYGFEASWQEGDLGVLTAQDQEVKLTGYGLAIEVQYKPEASPLQWALKSGLATGDDPNTQDSYEGFIFDRNYDVAFLMFNHTLGQKNFFRTEMIGTQNTDTTTTSHNQPDIEAISNVYYFAPSMTYKWSDQWNLQMVFATGWLQSEPLVGTDMDNSLGYELDLAFSFLPNERVTWVNQVGLFFPGAAFKGGSANNFDTDFAYGFVSKAAIRF